MYKFVLLDSLHKTRQECVLNFVQIILMQIKMWEYAWLFVQQLQMYMETHLLNNVFKHVLLVQIYMLKIQQECVHQLVHLLNQLLLIDLQEDVYWPVQYHNSHMPIIKREDAKVLANLTLAINPMLITQLLDVSQYVHQFQTIMLMTPQRLVFHFVQITQFQELIEIIQHVFANLFVILLSFITLIIR